MCLLTPIIRVLRRLRQGDHGCYGMGQPGLLSHKQHKTRQNKTQKQRDKQKTQKLISKDTGTGLQALLRGGMLGGPEALGSNRVKIKKRSGNTD